MQEKNMKKTLITIGVLFIIIFGLGFFMKAKGIDLIQNAAERDGSQILGAQIALGDISLDIFRGKVGLANFSIGQPEGFGEDKSFSVDNFTVQLEPMSLFGDHAKIDTILIDKPMLHLVMLGNETNFAKLQNNISTLITADSEPSTMKLSIKKLDLNETQLRINSDKYGEKNVTLANVHLENIGVDEGGVAPEEVLRLTMDALKPQIAKALIELGIKDKLNEELDKQLDDKLKGLPVPIADKLKEGLGGLFKKKKKKE